MASNESLKKDLAKRDEAPESGKTVRQLLADMSGEFARALPKEIGVERFTRGALTVIKSDKRLMKADPISLIAALQRCAELGLMPGTGDAEAYLVAFWNGKRNCYEVNLIPGYQGIIELMHRAGVGPVEAHLVYEADGFEYAIGDDGKFQHRPNLKTKDRGQPWLAYAFAWVRPGLRSKVVTFNRAEAEEVRDRFSQSYANTKTRDTSPWSTDFRSMWLKTPVRELRKWVPTSSERLELLGVYDDDVSTAAVADTLNTGDVIDGEVVEDVEDGPQEAAHEPTDREADWPEVTHAPARKPPGRRVKDTAPIDDVPGGQMTFDDVKPTGK